MHHHLSIAVAAIAAVAFFSTVQCQSAFAIDSFIPGRLACPEDVAVQIRPSNNLSDQEDAWRATRAPHVIDSINSWLARVNISGFDTKAYAQKLNKTNVPIIGLAVSGGGSTSGMGGLGIWQAFDRRYAPALQAGTGGLAQSLTYLTGLSGGGAITVSTLASNQYATVDNIRKAVNFSEDYSVGPTGNQSEYFQYLFENIMAKEESGFPVSIADLFGQWWSMYLPQEWQNRYYSDLALLNTSFSNGTGPMPILSLAEVIPGQSPNMGNLLYPGRNSTNGFNLTEYEVTPFEFGSWVGGRVQGFMPLLYLGTAMSQGQPSGVTCVTGLDRFSFFQGATANAWNFWLIDSFYGVPLFAKRALAALLPRRGRALVAARQDGGAPGDVVVPAADEDDFFAQFLNTTAETLQQDLNDTLWAWVPNPFQDYNKAMTGVSDLLLVDGSEAGETDPLRPLMIPQRGVDFIIVYEASEDSLYSWNNGTNLINSAQAAAQGGLPFPKIPSVTTMVLRNYTFRPTFFGCNDSAEVPLVLYLSNTPWTTYSNYSFRMTAFSDHQLNLTLDNAFQLATYGNGKLPGGEGSGWSTCLACAAIKKSVARVGMQLPEVCSRCWSRFCWDGTEEKGTVNVTKAFNLSPVLNKSLTYEKWNSTVWNA